MDLSSEMFAASRAVEKPHMDRLGALGLLTPSLARLCGWLPALGIVDAMPGKSGLYEPGAGPCHVVTPVVSNGDIADLCAWRPLDPARWWMRTGSGWALGADSLDAHGGWSSTLDLFATPAEWLAAGGDGVCILDWSAPELRQLAEWPSIICSNAALARALRDALSRPVGLPSITVTEVARAA